MEKLITFSCLVIISIVLIISLLTRHNQLSNSSIIVSDSREGIMEDALLSCLFPTIDQAVTAYYGQTKQFMLPEVLEIQRLETAQFHFKVKVRVTTFEGAHNPPYGTDTISIIMAEQIRVEKFDHIDEPLTEER
jgi:hypothetical protein